MYFRVNFEKVFFWEQYWAQYYVSIQFWDFTNISEFLKILTNRLAAH